MESPHDIIEVIARKNRKPFPEKPVKIYREDYQQFADKGFAISTDNQVVYREGSGNVSAARKILNLAKDLIVQYEDEDPFNLTRENLYACTRKEANLGRPLEIDPETGWKGYTITDKGYEVRHKGDYKGTYQRKDWAAYAWDLEVRESNDHPSKLNNIAKPPGFVRAVGREKASHFKGVHKYDKKDVRYNWVVRYDGETCGYYVDEIDAAYAYNLAVIENGGKEELNDVSKPPGFIKWTSKSKERDDQGRELPPGVTWVGPKERPMGGEKVHKLKGYYRVQLQ